MSTVRLRRDDDLPALVDALERQQPASGYPVGWPTPFPPEEFIRRRDEVAAYVAVTDGVPVGHVSARRVRADPDHLSAGDEATVWAAGHGLPVERLGSVSAFFLAPEAQGLGLGRALLQAALGALRDAGLAPCLDVVDAEGRAAHMYRRDGWRVVGHTHPDWLPPGRPPVTVMVLDEPGERPGLPHR